MYVYRDIDSHNLFLLTIFLTCHYKHGLSLDCYMGRKTEKLNDVWWGSC